MRHRSATRAPVESLVAARTASVALAYLMAASLAACAAESSMEYDGRAPGMGDGDDSEWHCITTADCPPGLVCSNNTCVSADDGMAPEQPAGHVFMKPEASPRFIYALSPHTDTMAIIDALGLDIETVPLPAEPTDLAVLPGRDSVAVVSREGKALTLLDSEEGDWRSWVVRLGRRFPAVSVCPEGRWAVLWTPDGEPPDAGAEGIVALVDLAQIESGDSVEVMEKAAGRRHTHVFFHRDGGRTSAVVVVGKDEVAVIDMDDLERPVPRRLLIPEQFTDVHSRQVISSGGGEHILIRSFVSPEILVFDSAHREMSTVALPAVATDITLVRWGPPVPPRTRAVVALRSAGMIGWFDLASAIANPDDPEIVETMTLEGVVPGQVTVSHDGRFAAVFTNVEDSSALGWIDFQEEQVFVFDRLQKWIRGVGIGPDGKTAIVLHRPDSSSTLADPYERAIAKEEGYSIVDLEQGYAQLKLTQGVPADQFVFSVDGDHAAVVISDSNRDHRIDAIDLGRLVTHTFSLASTPRFSGVLPGGPELTGDRIWVTQDHPAGRISFIGLTERTMRTITGYDLNAEVE